jgi:DNA polymerase-4
VTENLRGIPTAAATAAEIRARIFEETALTASAGISYNKFLAKLALRSPQAERAVRGVAQRKQEWPDGIAVPERPARIVVASSE